MYAEFYAIVTAFLRGLSVIPTRKGLRHGTPDFSVLIYLVVNSTLLWGVTFFLYPISVLTASGVEYFVLAGIFAPGVARLFRDRSFSRLGVAVSSPIVGTYLLFSVLGAYIFLGEEVTLYLAAGAVLVLFGINVLTWRGSSKAEWRRKDLLFPIIAALLFASSIDIRKIGLLVNDNSVLGAAITSTSSLVVVVISLALTKRDSFLNINRDAVKFFGVASLASSIAFLCYFMALSASSIVKIQPIAGSSSLFAILFSHLFLKDVEKITARIVLGAVLIASGMAFCFL